MQWRLLCDACELQDFSNLFLHVGSISDHFLEMLDLTKHDAGNKIAQIRGNRGITGASLVMFRKVISAARMMALE